MSWYAYFINPIDVHWEYLPTVDEFLTKIKSSAGQYYPYAYVDRITTEFEAAFENAQKLALEAGWEGDFRHDPSVFFLPDETEFAYGFAWKQDNNGDTVIVSPRPLFWLEQIAHTNTVIGS